AGEIFLVRFDFKGPWFICQCVVNNGVPQFNYTGRSQTGLTFAPQNNSSFQPPAAGLPSHPGFKYQIVRMPRPIGNPLELPRGTCIDITYSGVGNTQRQFPLPQGLISPASGLIVMVTPNGSIDCIYVNGSPTKPPIASLY